ncbi:MAG TPA: hypothetical protein VI603_03420 [Saprospiraceae bacterium]|nr:hypothetical protein [Saprospiraceae bacterium]
MTITKTTISWEYHPSDFLEISHQFQYLIYSLIFDRGLACATLSDPSHEIPIAIQKEIKEKVLHILKAQMLIKHKHYEIGEQKITQHYDNGRVLNSYTVAFEPGVYELKGSPVEFMIKDASGRIIKDSRSERIAEEKEFIQILASAKIHELLDKMLTSYSAAISDPANELIHLYELEDGLNRYFGDKQETIRQLGFSKERFDRLHKLCNDVPLSEGRHRGSKTNLRHATDEELFEARTIARDLILAFSSIV